MLKFIINQYWWAKGEEMKLCENCNVKDCAILNKTECPVNTLWKQEQEAKQTLAELEEMLRRN